MSSSDIICLYLCDLIGLQLKTKKMSRKYTLYFERPDVPTLSAKHNPATPHGTLVISHNDGVAAFNGECIKIDGLELEFFKIQYHIEKYVKCVGNDLILRTYGCINGENLNVPMNTDVDIITLCSGYHFRTGKVVSTTFNSVKMELDSRQLKHNDKYYQISLEDGKQLLTKVFHVTDDEDLSTVHILTEQAALRGIKHTIPGYISPHMGADYIFKFPLRDHVVSCSLIEAGHATVAKINACSVACMSDPVYIECRQGGNKLVSDRSDIQIDDERRSYLVRSELISNDKIIIRSDHFHGQIDFVLTQ